MRDRVPCITRDDLACAIRRRGGIVLWHRTCHGCRWAAGDDGCAILDAEDAPRAAPTPAQQAVAEWRLSGWRRGAQRWTEGPCPCGPEAPAHPGCSHCPWRRHAAGDRVRCGHPKGRPDEDVGLQFAAALGHKLRGLAHPGRPDWCPDAAGAAREEDSTP